MKNTMKKPVAIPVEKLRPLAMQGKKVLLVDADPQGDLTTCLGWQDTDSLPQTLSNKLSAVMREEQQDPFSGILSHEEKVDLVPSNLDLSALEMSLVTAMSRESVMKNYLSQVKDRYDYVLICSGSRYTRANRNRRGV